MKCKLRVDNAVSFPCYVCSIENVKRDSQTHTLAATTHNVTPIVLIVGLDCLPSEFYLLAHLLCLFSSLTPLDLHNIHTDTELPTVSSHATQTSPMSIFRPRTSKSLVLFLTEFDLTSELPDKLVRLEASNNESRNPQAGVLLGTDIREATPGLVPKIMQS